MVQIYNENGAPLWDTDSITTHDPRPGIEYAAPGGVERTDVPAEDGHGAGYVGMTAEDDDNSVAAAGAAYLAEQERLAGL